MSLDLKFRDTDGATKAHEADILLSPPPAYASVSKDDQGQPPWSIRWSTPVRLSNGAETAYKIWQRQSPTRFDYGYSYTKHAADPEYYFACSARPRNRKEADCGIFGVLKEMLQHRRDAGCGCTLRDIVMYLRREQLNGGLRKGRVVFRIMEGPDLEDGPRHYSAERPGRFDAPCKQRVFGEVRYLWLAMLVMGLLERHTKYCDCGGAGC
ncbi:hypothetical protein ANO11243_057090 [Dothideomycetidae sp. 11243]|nr:hypothetical protein ANO11243_057090 [fungal sp. No.11243]